LQGYRRGPLKRSDPDVQASLGKERGLFAGGCSVTVTNNLDEELLAPILIADAKYDTEIFDMGYVTPEAEHQILTGDPGMLADRIGPDAMVGHGVDGPPGVLLAAGKSVTFDITTDAHSVRVISMVAPTMVPDNYVSAVVDLGTGDMAAMTLDRFDIGHDEGTKSVKQVGEAVASVEFHKKMDEMDTMESKDTMN
jgi:hypothetical protein